MDEDRSGSEEVVEGEPGDVEVTAETTGSTEDGPTETGQPAGSPTGSGTEELPGSGTEEPPGPDPETPVSQDWQAEAEDGATGTPGVEPQKADGPTGDHGIPATTTTGDPSKDVRGPSVTEEARQQMEGDPALEEPGYGDLGHAEDRRILRDG